MGPSLVAQPATAAKSPRVPPGMAQLAWAAPPARGTLSAYHDPAYQQLLAAHDGCISRWLSLSRPGRLPLLLPLLVRELDGGCREAYSAYGYGGLCGQDGLDAAPALDDADVAALQRFLAASDIAALFIRHAPFLHNHRLWPESVQALNRVTYAAALCPQPDPAAHLAALPQKLRWSVQRARREGLSVQFTPLDALPAERLLDFHGLYDALMAAKTTDGYYRFPPAFFAAHAQTLGARCELAEIRHPATGALLAGALFLMDGAGWVHYHLSAAHRDAMRLQAMELLLTEARLVYGNRGLRALHLGGGHALDESDGLSRFKAQFASTRLAFHTTRLVCNAAAYQRERARMPLAHPQLFLIADARGPQPAH